MALQKTLKSSMFMHGRCLMKCLKETHFIAKMASLSSSKHLLFSTVSLPPSDPELDDDHVVTTAISILKHHPSKARWNHVHATAPHTGFTPSQCSQIILRLRNDPHRAFRFFKFTLRRSLCAHTLASYATIVHVLSRSRHKTRAQSIIQEALRKFPSEHDSLGVHPIFETLIKTYRGCDSAPFVFDLLINACVESRRVDEAVEIVRMLRCKNIYPGVQTCNALIELVVKSRGCFEGYDLYREIFVLGDEVVVVNKNGIKKVIPDVNTFNAVMVGFYREALVEKVEEVWAEMARFECMPDAYSYSIMMVAYCDDGRIQDATKVWEEMEDRGVRPDVVAYNTMIDGFCSVREMEKAEEFVQKMVMDGIESTCVTFEHLIKGYCKVGNIDSALLLYKDMGRKRFTPESSTTDAVIALLCDKNEIFRALNLMRLAKKKHEYNPSKKSYELLIEGLCIEGKLDQALRLQVDMVREGYEPDSKIYDVFIDGYIKQGNEEMAEKLKRESLNLGFSPGKT